MVLEADVAGPGMVLVGDIELVLGAVGAAVGRSSIRPGPSG